MLYRPEKISLLSRVGENVGAGVFVGVALLATAGWVYLLGSTFWKLLVWCFY